MRAARHRVQTVTWATYMPQRQPVRIELFYSPADPYAVTLTLLAAEPGESDTRWEIGRDLLRDGLTTLAGDDAASRVQVWPRDDGVHVALTLTGFRRATREELVQLIEMSKTQLAKFLHHTSDLVAYGGEDMSEAVDECIAALLGVAE